MIKSCSVDDFLVRKALFVLSVLKIYFYIYLRTFVLSSFIKKRQIVKESK